MRRLTAYELSQSLTILALFLWALAILQSKLIIDNYGLISSFKPLFFISLTALAIAAALLWTTKERHTFLLIIQTILLIISLYLTPYLLEGTARFQAGYYNQGYVDYIIRNGILNPKAIWYHSYPGFAILLSVFFEITGNVYPEIVMAVFPTIMMILYLLPLAIIMHNIDPEIHNGIYAAFWIFSIANWTSQEYYSPQATAFYIVLIIIAIMSRRWASGNYQTSHIIILIILAMAIAIMHAVTSIICFGAVVAIFIIWRFNNINYILLFATIIGGWTIFGAFILLGSLLPKFMLEAFNADALSFATYFFRFEATSPEHAFINQLRVIFTFVFLIIALIGFAVQHKRLSRANLSILAITFPAILLLPVLVYSGEFIIRVWLMFLLPMAYFSIQLVRKRLTYILLIIIVIIGIPVSMVTRYGNEIIDYTPPAEIQFSEFFFNHTNQGRVIAMVPPTIYKYLEKYSYFMYWSATPDPEFKNRLDVIKVKPPEWKTQYVSTSDRLMDLYRFIIAKPNQLMQAQKYLNESVQYNLVYSNNNVVLYTWE